MESPLTPGVESSVGRVLLGRAGTLILYSVKGEVHDMTACKRRTASNLQPHYFLAVDFQILSILRSTRCITPR